MKKKLLFFGKVANNILRSKANLGVSPFPKKVANPISLWFDAFSRVKGRSPA